MATKTTKKKSNVKTSFTNTKGQKVTVYKDGTKKYSGGTTSAPSSSGGGGSSPTLTPEQSASMIAQLKTATDILNGIKSNQTTTPAPTPTDTATPSASSFVYDYSAGGGAGDPIINNLRKEAGDDAGMDIDEDKIRRDVLKRFRTEIDATNNVYNDLVNRQEVTNANNEGGLRAMQNRQGLIGSGMGMAQTQDQRDKGNQAIGVVQAERALKIGSIMEVARKEALDEINSKRTAKANGATAYLKYVEDEDARKAKRVSSVVSALITQGLNPSEMSTKELQEIAKNLGVSTQDITDVYTTDTADVRAKEQASTREGAIVGLMKQGVNDPKEIYDLINYDDSGKKIGDISLKEINDVIAGVTKKEEGFALSEGQARYVKQPDGSYVRVAFNPKTYKPDGSTDEDGNPIPSFEQWASTVTMDSQIGKAGEKKIAELGRPLTAEESWQVMRDKYKELYGVNAPIKTADQHFTEVETLKKYGDTAVTDLGKLTQTNKNELKQAGLGEAQDQVKAYFLNTDPSFRDFYTRGVANGDFSTNASLDEVDATYTEWYNAKESGSSDDPFSGKTTAELLEMLNAEQ